MQKYRIKVEEYRNVKSSKQCNPGKKREKKNTVPASQLILIN